MITTAGVLETNKLASGAAWLLLLEVVHGATTLRYTSDLTVTTWNGFIWSLRPIRVESVKETLKAEITRVVVRIGISDLDTALMNTMEADGFVGSTVTLYIVNSTLLAAPTAEVTEQYTVVESDMDTEWITLTVGMNNPMLRRFPRDNYVPSTCRNRFRGTICRYAIRPETKSGLLGPGTNISFEQRPGTTDFIRYTGADFAGVGDRFAVNDPISVTGSKRNDGEYTISRIVIDGTSNRSFLHILGSDTDASFALEDEPQGATVTVATICDKTLTTCTQFNNQPQFGATPGIPEGVFG